MLSHTDIHGTRALSHRYPWDTVLSHTYIHGTQCLVTHISMGHIAQSHRYPWDTVLSHTDINEAHHDFINDVTILYNHHCPLRRLNNNNKSEKNLGSRMVSKKVIQTVSFE